jgi:hypothetical protein
MAWRFCRGAGGCWVRVLEAPTFAEAWRYVAAMFPGSAVVVLEHTRDPNLEPKLKA